MIENPYVGKVFAGVEIGEEIGRGGMGVVMMGRRRSDDATVAVKILPPTEAGDSSYIERFEREAKLLMQLRHPNILHVDNMGHAPDGTYFIVMEFIDGVSLGDLIHQKGSLPVEQASAILVDAAKGLRAAHQQNVIHRDIKPDNILITSGGTVKLADFGLAKDTSDNVKLTVTGQVMGTPAFMSPEQGKGNPVDHRTDLYSLGVTFYFMLSGDRPFAGTSPIEVVLQHIKQPPPPLRERVPDLPDELYNLVDRLLAKEADDRISSCEEIIDTLESLAEREGWELAPPAPQAEEAADLDLTLDVGLGEMVREAVASDKTQITSDQGPSMQVVPTEELIGDVDDTMVGRTIAGKYLIRSKLGEGGMGAVYLVRHIHLDQDYALKVLNPDIAANASFRERFLREAKAATAFTHKHAIQIRDFGQEEDMLYMSMDFSRGQTLKQILRKEGAISEMRTAVIAQQVLSALVEAHAAGLIHRDLKPDNLIIEKRRGKDHVRILDFGVAKIMGDAAQETLTEDSALTRTGTVVGTVQYMSPEQASGSAAIDGRSDLYSLATIMYECLTGSRPIEAENMQQMIYKLATEDPVPLRKRVKGVSKRFGDLVMRNLRRDPAGRSDSAAAFLAELESCSDHLHSTIALRRSGLGIVLPALIATAVAVAALLLILFVFKPFEGPAPSPAPAPAPGPAPPPEPGPSRPSAEDLAAEKQKLYERCLAEGDEAFGRKAWPAALEAYQKAREQRQTDEIEVRLRKTKWEQHLAAYEAARAKKDYRKALGEVTYGLLQNHTSIEQQRSASQWEKELEELLDRAESLFADASSQDEAGRLLAALPLYTSYLEEFPLGRHREKALERKAAIEAALEAFEGLVVRTDPPGAEVVVDGVSVGRTPLLYGGITPGQHEILLDAKGHLPLKKKVTYEKGARLEMTEKLQTEKFGSIRVFAQGRGVVVRWKNRSLGMTPVVIERVSPGEHHIEVVGENDAAYRMTVTVEEGRTARIEVDMAALTAAEKKAFEALPRGETLEQTRKLYQDFLDAYPRGRYAPACRKILAALDEEQRAYEACAAGGDPEALVRACRAYLSRYEREAYPSGWFGETVRSRLDEVLAAREKAAFEAIGRADTFLGKRRAAEQYLDAYPKGRYADEAKAARDAAAAEEQLYLRFQNTAHYGKKLAHGRRYLRVYPQGLRKEAVEKRMEALEAEEKGFYQPLTEIRDVDRIIAKAQAYLLNFPGSDNAPDVEKRLRSARQERELFVRTEKGPDQCRAYLDAYPEGWYRKKVQERLERFGWTADEAGGYGFTGTLPPGVARGEKPGLYRSRWDEAPMVFVPGGYFPMGTEDYYGEDQDKPSVVVYVSGFFLDRYEVSNRQYGRFLAWLEKAADPRKYSHETEPEDKGHTPAYWKDERFNRPDQPVVGVDWWDAYAYARWAGKLLPTEAQWEKAASAAILKKRKLRYPWGDREPDEGLCNGDGRLETTVSVASLPQGASPFGAEQMAGNAAEWCLDAYLPDFLERIRAKYPPESGRYVSNPWNNAKAKVHAIRGGSFRDDAADLVTTRRKGFSGRARTVGFRCAVWAGK